MQGWVYTKVLPKGESPNINPIVFGYVVKLDGIVVGTIKRNYSGRTSTWRGTITEGLMDGCTGVCFDSREFEKVLEWFKNNYWSVIEEHGPRNSGVG